MKNSEEQKLLNITLDKILSIVDHNKRLYKKTSQKIRTLSRLSNDLNAF